MVLQRNRRYLNRRYLMSSTGLRIVTMVVSMALATLSWGGAQAAPGHSGPHQGGK
jgi:hypothetical protein